MNILYKATGPTYGVGAGAHLGTGSSDAAGLTWPPHAPIDTAVQYWPHQQGVPYTPVASCYGLQEQRYSVSNDHMDSSCSVNKQVPPSTGVHEQMEWSPQREQRGRWVWHPSPTTPHPPSPPPRLMAPTEHRNPERWEAFEALPIPTPSARQAQQAPGHVPDPIYSNTPLSGPRMSQSRPVRMTENHHTDHESGLIRGRASSQVLDPVGAVQASRSGLPLLRHESQTGQPLPPPPPENPSSLAEQNNLDMRSQQGHSSLKENVRPPSKGILRRDIRYRSRGEDSAPSVHFRVGPNDTSIVRRFPSELDASTTSVRRPAIASISRHASNKTKYDVDSGDSKPIITPAKDPQHVPASVSLTTPRTSAMAPSPVERPQPSCRRSATPFHPNPQPVSPPSSSSRRRLGQKEKKFVAKALQVAQQLVLGSVASDTDTEESDELNIRPAGKDGDTTSAYLRGPVVRQQQAPSPTTTSQDSSDEGDDTAAVARQSIRSRNSQTRPSQSAKSSSRGRSDSDKKANTQRENSATAGRGARTSRLCRAPSLINVPVNVPNPRATKLSSSKTSGNMAHTASQRRILARPQSPSSAATDSDSSFADDVPSVDSDTETDEPQSGLKPMSSYKVPSVPQSQAQAVAQSSQADRIGQDKVKKITSRNIKIIPNRTKTQPRDRYAEELVVDDLLESIEEFSDRASPVPVAMPGTTPGYDLPVRRLSTIPEEIDEDLHAITARQKQTSSDAFWADGGELNFEVWRDGY